MAQSSVEYQRDFADVTEEAPIQVLHVDDDANFLKVAKPILEMQGGFRVETALSVEEAMERMKQREFDAIVCDYVMLGRDGLQFLKELRDGGNSIPFVMFTGKGREEVAIEALNLGADRYFNKIGDPETVYGELAHGIRRVVERKKAEDALNESERRYRKLFKSTKDGIMISGPDDKISSVNSAAAEMLGYKEPEELLGTPMVELCEDPEQRKKLFEKLKKKGYLKDFEVVGRRRDGSTFIGTGTFTLHRDEAGNILRTEGIFRDVTKRKQVEETVRESEEKYRSIVELAPDGIITVNTRGVVTSVNSAFSRLTGFAEDELVGKHFTKLGTVRMREIPKYIRFFSVVLRGKKSSPIDFSYRRKDGTFGWAEAQAGLLKSRGKTIGVQAIVREITERKKADTKLEEVNEKLGVVGELTRHDARNKLSTVKMSTFLMKQRLADDPEALNHLNEIESACKQVERIFDFAKVYEKIGVEELAYIDVEKTLSEAVMLFPDLQAMKVVNDCKGLTVLGDSLLRQLFYNLIDNSLKHGEKVSRIGLYCKEAGKGQLKLVYEDDGAGIPRAEKKKIFKEGYGKDTGYGLYLISKMCDVYGWSIRETGKQGKGAQFTITIPKLSQDGRESFRIK